LPLFLTKHRTMKMYWGVLWEVGTERNNWLHGTEFFLRSLQSLS